MRVSQATSVSSGRTGWFKSDFSKDATSCVEVRLGGNAVFVRDSKYTGNPADQPVVTVDPAQWRSFLDLVLSCQSGELDGEIAMTVHSDGSAVIAARGVVLSYRSDEWDAFTKGVANGQFDR